MIQNTLKYSILFLCLVILNIQTETAKSYYTDTYLKIDSMLTEKTFLNFEKAVFLTENAYFENQINLNQERKNMKNIFKSKGYINNDFSSADKWYSYNHEIDGYVATPDGSLKKYNVETTKTTTVSTYMPSDPNDPGRKNENNPIDIPMEKEREQTKIEPDKKPNLNFLSGRKLR